MKWLIDKKLNIDEATKLGRSAFMAAAYYGRVKATEFLLQQGCSTDMIDEEGDTVFHIAAKSDRNDDTKQEIIRCLMKGNVKSDVKNKVSNDICRIVKKNGESSGKLFLFAR
jgi:ankyrin repeat protein